VARIAVIPGDGIGHEVTAQALKVLRRLDERFGLGLDLVPWDLGAERYLTTGTTITDQEMAELGSAYDAILLGALGDPRVPGNEHARDILLGLRFRLDLYVNLRPVRLLAAEHSPLRNVEPGDVDLVVFRENTEGSYVGMGGVFKRGTADEVAIEEDVNTAKGVERILRAAFEHASRTGRASPWPTSPTPCGMQGSCGGGSSMRSAAEYPGVARRAMYIDALAMDLVLRPGRYQVIVTSNLFGDILSDLAAGLVGGLGLAPSANLHPGRIGLFEPVHGSAPDIAGTDRANPIAAVLTTALMLQYLGHDEAAGALEQAVDAAIGRARRPPTWAATSGPTPPVTGSAR
jgi:3-isopropylmalate dehydrogenase